MTIISRSTDCVYCGDGHGNSCYIVYDDGDYCFSCGGGSKKPDGFYAFRPRVEVAQEYFIPEYTFNVREFSPLVLKWLYSYHLADKDIRQANIAYCPANKGGDESLLFPAALTEDNEMVEFQRRYFPKRFYSSRNIREVVKYFRHDSGNMLYVVEDFISALRLSMHANVVCLFGTKLNKALEGFLLRGWEDIRIWLDPDEPGIYASREIEGQICKGIAQKMRRYPLMNTGAVEITIVSSHKQPKELSPYEIAEVIDARKNIQPFVQAANGRCD